jgi:hypothetical protein
MSQLSESNQDDNLSSSIDPGFINHRKCISIFGNALINSYNFHTKSSSNWLDQWKNNHLFVNLVMEFCKHEKIKTLSEVLFQPAEGNIFCSFEAVKSNKNLFERDRVRNQIVFSNGFEKKVLIELGKEHFISSTLKSYLGGQMGEDTTNVVIIGEIRSIAEDQILVHPLIVGFRASPLQRFQQAVMLGYPTMRVDEYEYFPEEVDEFSECQNIPPTNDWQDYMKETPEEEIKKKFCKLLGDLPRKDWGGELCDHFSENLHLEGTPISAAFIFKGPAQFRAMTIDLLGKRGDQLYRLAQTPAKLLIVQHCHAPTEAVLATLRAFATSPVNPRKYCFISGLNTYRILRAYDLL